MKFDTRKSIYWAVIVWSFAFIFHLTAPAEKQSQSQPVRAEITDGYSVSNVGFRE